MRDVLLGAALLGAAGSPLCAQVASTTPAAGGMADNYTAVARGYAAVPWNPAALGLAGPESSATIGAFRGQAGMTPVSLSDLARYQGELVPVQVRQRWLSDIRREGGQAGAAGFDITWAGFQAGRFAAMISTSARAMNDVSPGMAELLLFGNADNDGNPRAIDLGGSDISTHMYSTAAISFGTPVRVNGHSRVAVGVTARYTIGHALAVSQPSRGSATDDPLGLELSFPIAYTPVFYDDDRYWIRAGGGFGVDAAVAYQTGPWVVAAVAQNLLSRFEWDFGRMRFRALEVLFSDTTVASDSEWQPMAGAPAELQALVEATKFHPVLHVGGSYQHSPALLVAADARVGSTEGMATRPPVHAGAGLQYRPIPRLPVQAGAAWVRLGDNRSGLQFGAGVGVELGSFLVSASGSLRNVGLGPERIVMVSLLSHTFGAAPRTAR